MPWRRTALLLVLLAPALGAQPPDAPPASLRGDNPATAQRVRERLARLRAEPDADAIAEAVALLQSAGDDWLPLDGQHHRPARAVVQAALAALPLPALQRFRDRADPGARQPFEAGRDRRDASLLRQCVERTFPSRPSLDALELLGELAAERGEYGEALRYWRRIAPPQVAPDGDQSGGEATCGDYDGDRANLIARVALAELRAGRVADARATVGRLREEFPGASGSIAGETGNYAAILARRIASPPPPLPEAPSAEWPTFGGDWGRSGRISGPPPDFWPTAPAWRTRLPDGPSPGTRPRPIASTPAHCAFHPVIVGGRAYVADAARVFSFDLTTGAPAASYDFRDEPEAATWRGSLDLALPAAAGADFTLSATNGVLLARLGVAGIAPPRPDGDAPKGPTSFLVGLEPGGGKLRPLWKLPPPADGAENFAQWEGAPVAADGRLYAAYTRFDGNRFTQGIACYSDPPGPPLWLRDLFDAPAALGGEPRQRHELLTLAGDNLVLATGAGVVVAVGRDSGRPAWAYRTPRVVRPVAPVFARDLAPPVFAGGRVVVAPADSDQLWCLDASTGAKKWQAGPVQIDQLLGVSQGRAIATTLEPTRGLRGYDLATGGVREPEGWRQHAPPLRSFGRGLLTRDLVLWPARDAGGLLLDAATGRRASAFTLSDLHGNCAYADGVLVVATPTAVYGYVGKSRPSAGPAPEVVAAESRARWRFGTPSAIPGDSGRDSAPEPPGDWRPLEVRATVTLPDPAARPLEPFRGRFLLHAPPSLPGLGPELPADARRLLVVDCSRLHAFAVGASSPAWSAAVPPGLTPTHAAVVGELIVVGGVEGLWGVRRRDGGTVWRLPAPTWDDLAPAESPRPRAGRGPPGPGFCDFALVGGRPVVRLGDHHLIGVHPVTGAVGWRLGADRRRDWTGPPLPGAAGFGAEFAPISPRLLGVQLSTGERWAVDAETGSIHDTMPGAPTPWATPPSGRDGPSLAAVADGPDRVTAFTPESGQRRWHFEAKNLSGLDGTAPRVALGRRSALAVVGRNSGADVVSLDPESGRPFGPPRLLPAATADLRHALETDDGVVLPTQSPTGAALVSVGASAWSAKLPAPGPWLLRPGVGAIWATPAVPPALDAPAEMVARLGRRGLAAFDLRRLPLLGWGAYDAWADRRAPVLALDPTTGRVRQRLDLAAGARLWLQAVPGGLVAATPGRVYWLR